LFSQTTERAIRAALQAHAGQCRKGAPDEPYVVHPLHIALLLARHGAEELVIQAALLHDVVEDCEGWDVERVEREFGARVASVVAELTEDKSLAWNQRKRAAVDAVPGYSAEAATIKAADKLHNLESMVHALAACRDEDRFWAPFNGGRERTLVMSGELVAALERRVDPKFGRALRAALERLTELSALHRDPVPGP
jgi:(p)ppGpp synthase/HD superfamily hydrolase